jgi:hypothetical protein
MKKTYVYLGLAVVAVVALAVLIYPQIKSASSNENQTEDSSMSEANHSVDFTLAVLTRQAIIVNTEFTATAVITNNTDKTISYVLGSGSNTWPDAIVLELPVGLAKVENQNAAMTADLQTKQLKPGESVRFEIPLIASTAEQFEVKAEFAYNTSEDIFGDATDKVSASFPLTVNE